MYARRSTSDPQLPTAQAFAFQNQHDERSYLVRQRSHTSRLLEALAAQLLGQWLFSPNMAHTWFQPCLARHNGIHERCHPRRASSDDNFPRGSRVRFTKGWVAAAAHERTPIWSPLEISLSGSFASIGPTGDSALNTASYAETAK